MVSLSLVRYVNGADYFSVRFQVVIANNGIVSETPFFCTHTHTNFFKGIIAVEEFSSIRVELRDFWNRACHRLYCHTHCVANEEEELASHDQGRSPVKLSLASESGSSPGYASTQRPIQPHTQRSKAIVVDFPPFRRHCHQLARPLLSQHQQLSRPPRIQSHGVGRDCCSLQCSPTALRPRPQPA